MFQDGRHITIMPASLTNRVPQSRLAVLPEAIILPEASYVPLVLSDRQNWCWPSELRDSPTHKERGAQNTMSDQMPFPFNNFTYFFTLFSKFFSSFHHCTCSLSVSRQYLALDGIYHPLRAAFPNNSTLRERFTRNRTPRHTGFSPSMTSCSKEHRQGAAPKSPSTNYNSGTEGTRFQIWAFAASLAVTKAIPVGFFSSAYWYA